MEQRKQVFLALEGLEIRKQIKSVSMIGKSVLEMYVPVHHREKVETALNSIEAKILKDFDLNQTPYAKEGDLEKLKEKTSSRIGYLLSKNDNTNMRKCILEGIANEIVNKALLKEAAFRQNREEPNQLW